MFKEEATRARSAFVFLAAVKPSRRTWESQLPSAHAHPSSLALHSLIQIREEEPSGKVKSPAELASPVKEKAETLCHSVSAPECHLSIYSQPTETTIRLPFKPGFLVAIATIQDSKLDFKL